MNQRSELVDEETFFGREQLGSQVERCLCGLKARGEALTAQGEEVRAQMCGMFARGEAALQGCQCRGLRLSQTRTGFLILDGGELCHELGGSGLKSVKVAHDLFLCGPGILEKDVEGMWLGGLPVQAPASAAFDATGCVHLAASSCEKSCVLFLLYWTEREEASRSLFQ